jgi:hypothetical protein
MDLITADYFSILSIQDCQDKSKIQQEDSFHQQIGFQLKEEASELLHLEHSFV